MCGRSLSYFVERAWPHIISDTFQHNWHIDAVCEHLEAIADGQITRLLINIPPGTSKSTMVNVLYPAWLWGPGKQPHHKYISASHEQGLAVRDNRMMRNLVTSEWYQRLWPLKLQGDQNEKLYYENEKKGFRQACAVTSMTGRRGHTVAWDDPMSAEKAHSDLGRETVLRILKETVPTRLNDPATSAIIIIMQRLHEDDPSGYILANDLGYEHLCIPMEFEPERKCVTSIGWEDPRKEPGDLLDPVRFPPEVIERDKKAMGSYAWAGQMQQRPAPLEGGLWKLRWFKRSTIVPEEYPMRTIHSWDTAYKKDQHNDPSACGVWKVRDQTNEAYLKEAFSERMEYPELRKRIVELAERDNPDVILIEDKASGQSLIQDLKTNTRLPVVAIKAENDKMTRAVAAAGTIEAGRVILPTDAFWLDTYLNEILTFPNGKHDDQVDQTSQFINWWRRQDKNAAYQSLLKELYNL